MTDAIAFTPATSVEPAQDRGRLVKGIVFGLIASTIGGTFLAFSRAGLTQSGLGTAEIAFLRLGIAGLVFLPWLIWKWRDFRQQMTLMDVLLYVTLIGPPFAIICISGYYFAPLVHGAVFLPGSLLIFGTAISAVLLGKPIDRVKKASIAVICVGFVLIAAPGFIAAGPKVLVGDVLFLWSGAQWAAFAALVGKRGTDPALAVASLSVFSLFVYCPLYLAMFGTEIFAAIPPATLALNALIHGLMAGAIAVLSYSLCVGYLGSGPAALFPALVPILTLVIGIPLTGEWLSATEWLAVAIIAGGLMASVRVWERLDSLKAAWARRPGGKDRA